MRRFQDLEVEEMQMRKMPILYRRNIIHQTMHIITTHKLFEPLTNNFCKIETLKENYSQTYGSSGKYIYVQLCNLGRM